MRENWGPIPNSESDEESHVGSQNGSRDSRFNDGPGLNFSPILTGWVESTNIPSPLVLSPLAYVAANPDIILIMEEGGKFHQVWNLMKEMGWTWTRSNLEKRAKRILVDEWIHQSPDGTKFYTDEEIMSFLRENIPLREYNEEDESGEEESSEDKEEEEDESGEEESSGDEEESASSSSTLRFSVLWIELKVLGWTWDYGDGLINVVYLKPDVTKKDGVMGVDMFSSEEDVVAHIQANVPFLAQRLCQQPPPPSPPPSHHSSPVSSSYTKRGRKTKKPPMIPPLHSSSSSTSQMEGRGAGQHKRRSLEGQEGRKGRGSGDGGQTASTKKKRARPKTLHPSTKRERGTGGKRFLGESKRRRREASNEEEEGLGDFDQDRVEEEEEEELESSPTPSTTKDSHSSFSSSQTKNSLLQGGKIFSPYSFLLTGFPDEPSSLIYPSTPLPTRQDLSSVICQLGGIVISSLSQQTGNSLRFSSDWKTNQSLVVISHPHAYRRLNHLWGHVKGIGALHFRWIEDCSESRKHLSPDPYALPSGPSFSLGQFIFPSSYSTSSPPSFFRGVSLLLINIPEILQECGCSIIGLEDWKQFPSLRKPSAVVVNTALFSGGLPSSSSSDPTTLPWEEAIQLSLKNDVPVVGMEWMVQCLIHGALLSTSASPHFTLPHAFQIDGEGEGFVQMDRGKILTALRHNKERFEIGDVVTYASANKVPLSTKEDYCHVGRIVQFYLSGANAESFLVEIQRLRHVKGDTNRLILTEEKRSFVPLEKVGGRVVLLSKEDFSSRAYSEDEGIFYWTASHISGERSEGRKLSWGERGQEGDCYNDPDF